MFIGEGSIYIFYLVKRWKENKAKREGKNIETEEDKAQKSGLIHGINPFLLAIPASFYMVASTLVIFGLNLVAASVYQMMKGGLVFFTAVLSYFILKKVLRRF